MKASNDGPTIELHLLKTTEKILWDVGLLAVITLGGVSDEPKKYRYNGRHPHIPSAFPERKCASPGLLKVVELNQLKYVYAVLLSTLCVNAYVVFQ